jgi:Tfp pilus assembly protein PilN
VNWRPRRRSYPPLRRRLFVATVLIVIVSIGIAFGVGVVLTRNAVETANIDGLSRQAELIKNQEESAILPFSAARLNRLRSFLTKQHEQIHLFDLKRATRYLPDPQRIDLVGDKAA